MDPLSDVLSLLKPQSLMSAGFDVAGPWAIAFPDAPRTIKCGALVRGGCFIAVDGEEPVWFGPGDAFLLPAGRPFRMATDPGLPAIPAQTVFSPARSGSIVTLHGGGDVFLVSSRFGLEGAHADILLGLLPAVVRIRDRDGDGMRWPVERMMRELGTDAAGSALVVRHLAHMMLVEALRICLKEGAEGSVGWLYALSDPRIGAAIGAMHADPARRWTLALLAAEAGMSRSVFAERFRALVGKAPMDYLVTWRMRIAADRLARAGEPVSGVALALGYESESAFGAAFKRVVGMSPGRYSRVSVEARSAETSSSS